MLEIIKEVIQSPAGSFGSMFAVVCLILFLTYKAGKIIEKFKVVNKISSAIDAIKDDISEIKAFIQVYRQTNNPFAQSQSPINLTKKGNEVSDELFVKRIINDNWKSISSKIKKKLKKEDNPYDIQEICFEIGEKYSKIMSENDFDHIKKYAFNQGHNLSDYDIIFGIEIRNKYFDSEGYNVKEVDKYDPNNGSN